MSLHAGRLAIKKGSIVVALNDYDSHSKEELAVKKDERLKILKVVDER